MNNCNSAPCHDYAAICLAREGCNVALDFARVADVDRAYLQTERWRCRLDGAELTDPLGYGAITQDRRSRHAGRNLFEQLQPFRAHAVLERGKTGGVAAWPRQTRDQATADRISDLRKHDRHGPGRLEQGLHDSAAGGEDNVWRQCKQFRSVFASVVGITGAPADVDPHVAALGQA